MAGGTVTVTGRQSIVVGHQCSECGFPVLMIINVDLKASKQYTFSSGKASEEARNALEVGIKGVYAGIDRIRNTKRVITEIEENNYSLEWGFFRTIKFYGADARCPYCSNIEPWQSDSSTRKMNDLSEDSFPKAFNDSKAASVWAALKVKEMTGEIEKTRENADLVQKAVKDAETSEERMKDLKAELASVPELQTKADVISTMEKLKEEQNKLGRFELKKKGEIKHQLKELGKQIETLEKVIKEKADPISQRLNEEERKRRLSLATAYGCRDEVASKHLNNSFVFFYEPKDSTEAVKEENAGAGSEGNPVQNGSEEDLHQKTVIERMKGFKELLDLGIITQDEFDRKKKELLGL